LQGVIEVHRVLAGIGEEVHATLVDGAHAKFSGHGDLPAFALFAIPIRVSDAGIRTAPS
jgi:hypothetical protein